MCSSLLFLCHVLSISCMIHACICTNQANIPSSCTLFDVCKLHFLPDIFKAPAILSKQACPVIAKLGSNIVHMLITQTCDFHAPKGVWNVIICALVWSVFLATLLLDEQCAWNALKPSVWFPKEGQPSISRWSLLSMLVLNLNSSPREWSVGANTTHWSQVKG